MIRTWDIANAERVFATDQGITRPTVPTRRAIADACSMVRLAVFMTVTAAATITSSPPLPLDKLGATSDVRVVIERSVIPVKRGPEKKKRPGIDFARGRSAKQLADGFRAVFRPASDIDDSSDDGFVFR